MPLNKEQTPKRAPKAKQSPAPRKQASTGAVRTVKKRDGNNPVKIY